MQPLNSVKSLFLGIAEVRVWSLLAGLSLASRFRRSYFGVAWLFIGFVVFSVSTGVVWARLMRQDPVFMISYIGMGFAVWGFIVAALTEGSGSLVLSAGYMKQLNVRYSVYAMRSVAVNAAVCLTQIVATILVRVLAGGGLSFAAVLIVPGLAILFSAGIAVTIILGYLGARFRDLAHGLQSITNLLFVLTPIIYPAQVLRDRGGGLIVDLNPFYPFVEIVRRPVVEGLPATLQSYGLAIAVTVALWIGAVATHIHYGKRVVYFV